MSEPIEVVDLTMTDKIRRYCHASVGGKDATEVLGDFQEELPWPKEAMKEAEELLGDGNAKVTVGAELKYNDYGNAAGSSCYVSVTCNQDMETIISARGLGQALARDFVEQGYEEMKGLLEVKLGRRPQDKVILSITEDPPAKRSPKHIKAPKLRKPEFKR